MWYSVVIINDRIMNDLASQLSEIGLEGNEASVYAACLELGPATILEISRKTQTNRTSLYGVVERLIHVGLLARSSAGKRAVFVAEPPEKLSLLLKKRMEKLDDLLPELISLGRKGTVKPRMRYYDGIEGIKTVYRDSLTTKDHALFAFVGVERLTAQSKVLNDFWEGEYRIGRQKYGILGKIVVPDNAEGKLFQSKDSSSRRETRLVPASTYNFDGEVLLYGDTVAFISYTDNEEFALSLESKAIAKTMKMIWQIVWSAGY